MEKKAQYAHYVSRERDPSPGQAVLLVIDMQEYFRGTASPILDATQRTIQTCRDAGIPVVYTQHSHRSPKDHGMLKKWWGQLILADSPEAALMPEVRKRDEDKLVPKTTYSSFYRTDLEEYLRQSGKEEVIVTGVMTNLCCETTAREAFVRGFRVFFSTDATATSDPDLHLSTLKNMAYGFAYLVDAPKLEASLKKTKH